MDEPTPTKDPRDPDSNDLHPFHHAGHGQDGLPVNPLSPTPPPSPTFKVPETAKPPIEARAVPLPPSPPLESFEALDLRDHEFVSVPLGLDAFSLPSPCLSTESTPTPSISTPGSRKRNPSTQYENDGDDDGNDESNLETQRTSQHEDDEDDNRENDIHEDDIHEDDDDQADDDEDDDDQADDDEDDFELVGNHDDEIDLVDDDEGDDHEYHNHEEDDYLVGNNVDDVVAEPPRPLSPQPQETRSLGREWNTANSLFRADKVWRKQTPTWKQLTTFLKKLGFVRYSRGGSKYGFKRNDELCPWPLTEAPLKEIQAHAPHGWDPNGRGIRGTMKGVKDDLEAGGVDLDLLEKYFN